MSKNSSAVSFPFNPNFLKGFPLLKPSTLLVSKSIKDIPFAPADWSVLAATIIRSADPPLVMNILEPFRAVSYTHLRAHETV